MEFKLVFFAIVLVGILVTAVGVIVNDMGVEYNSGVTSDLGSYDKVGETSDYVNVYQGNISTQSGEASIDPETVTYKGVFGIIANIFKPFTIVTSMIDDTFERFGLPDYVKIGIITMIIASVVFTLIAIIFRTNRPNV